MQKRLALFVLGAFAAAAPVSAQMKFGLVAGAISATVATTNNPDYSVTSRIGFSGGISLNAKLSKGISLAPEALYVMKGGKESNKVTPTITADVKANYLEVPVLFRVMLGEGSMRPFVTAGPDMSFKLSCNLTIAGAGAANGTSDCNKTTDNTSGIKSTDFGVMFGAGLAGERLSVSVRYDLGLTNDARDESVGAVGAKNRAFMVMVGVTL